MGGSAGDPGEGQRQRTVGHHRVAHPGGHLEGHDPGTARAAGGGQHHRRRRRHRAPEADIRRGEHPATGRRVDALLRRQHQPRRLRHRLGQQHPRHDRPPREVAHEEGLVAGHLPAGRRRHAGVDLHQGRDEAERRPVRQPVEHGGEVDGRRRGGGLAPFVRVALPGERPQVAHDRAHAREEVLRRAVPRQLHAEALLDRIHQHHDVERVQVELAADQRHVVGDLRVGPQPQVAAEQVLDPVGERGVHRHTVRGSASAVKSRRRGCVTVARFSAARRRPGRAAGTGRGWNGWRGNGCRARSPRTVSPRPPPRLGPRDEPHAAHIEKLNSFHGHLLHPFKSVPSVACLGRAAECSNVRGMHRNHEPPREAAGAGGREVVRILTAMDPRLQIFWPNRSPVKRVRQYSGRRNRFQPRDGAACCSTLAGCNRPKEKEHDRFPLPCFAASGPRRCRRQF